MPAPDLDAWLPDPVVRTHHRRQGAVPPDTLWRAAAEVRLDDTRTLGRLVRWRIPGTPGELRFADLFRAYPFVLLEHGEDWSLSGLCGRIWTLQRDYPRLARPEDFRAWDRPGTVKVLLAHWVEPAGPGHSALVSETRVYPVDPRASVRLRSLWALVGVFERLIGAEPLPLAVARAERSVADAGRA